MQKYKRY